MKNELDNLRQLLSALACNKDEILVFLKLFTSTGLSVSQIAERSGIERNKCYRVIEDLASKELVGQMADKKVKTFLAKSPRELQAILERKIQANLKTAASFKNSIPSLNQMTRTGGRATKVSYFQKNQTQKLLDDILYNHDYKGIFDPGITFSYQPELFKKWYEHQNQSEQRIRELIPMSAINFYNLANKIQNPNYKIKMADKSFKFPADLIIYDDKIYLASYRSKVALLIEDQDLYTAFNSMFDGLWQN